MTVDLSKYEAACKRLRKANDKLLEQFGGWLGAQRLSDSTIRRHVENAGFYVNEFLLYSDPVPAKDGIDSISMYLGYWFIKKAMWSSPEAIRSSAASLKKFYTFLHEQGQVAKEDLDDLKSTIKEEMPDWLATVDRYADQSITDMRDVWGR